MSINYLKYAVVIASKVIFSGYTCLESTSKCLNRANLHLVACAFEFQKRNWNAIAQKDVKKKSINLSIILSARIRWFTVQFS